jgi:pimeloyl-ACP methyl ester carboxylesterase
MPSKNLLFFTGLGAPAVLFTPWFQVFRWFGYDIHVVPNSAFSFDPVSVFAEHAVELSSRFDALDVVAVSYGGNAALYAAHLSPELCEKTGKMALVCAPVLGTPGLLQPFRKLLPERVARPLEEMARNSPITESIRELGNREQLPFALHCLYHERDFIAPRETATLPGKGTAHKLDFQWNCVPGLVMHQAACVNPKTLSTLVKILIGP